MSLRLRVWLSVVGLLALTVLAAWMLTGSVVLGALVGSLTDERVDTAVYVANEVRQEEGPQARIERARQLSRELGVSLRLHEELPDRHGDASWRAVQRDGVTVFVARGHRGRRAPVLVAMGPDGGAPFLAVRFRTDLEQPRRAVALGLVLLLAAGVLASVAASRWMLRPLELAGAAMQRVADGDLSHRVEATGTDVTGRMGATFNAMADRVQGMVEGQRELMAAVSHELRTPLARMRLQAELLRDAGAPEARIAALEADIAEVDALVGELLESARMHQGQLALRLEEVQLLPLVQDCLAAEDLGARPVTVDVPAELVLPADPARLGRVLRNLLSNIRRYTPPDAAVTVRASKVRSEDGGHVILAVADAGPGVPDADLPRLFEPFYRADGASRRATGGLGLGLMLVKQIVQAHGGSVDAMNRPAGGLLVRVVLPLRGPVEAPA